LQVEELEARLTPSSTQSTNWSGFAIPAANNSVSLVSASWTVPKVSGTGTAYSSTWVGIDGFSSSTVEQIGTDSDLVNGQPVYYAWYEFYPSYSVQVPLNVAAGDSISAKVSYASGAFTAQITDANDPANAQTFSITKSTPGAQRSSAEWIQEAPSSGFGILPLANFGTVTFNNAQTTIGGATGPTGNWASSAASIDMLNSRTGAVQAHTSALNASGTSFSVSYVPATSTTTSTGGGGGHHRWWRETNVPTPAQTSTTATTSASQANTTTSTSNLLIGVPTAPAGALAPAALPAGAVPSNTPVAPVGAVLSQGAPPRAASATPALSSGSGQIEQLDSLWLPNATDEALPMPLPAPSTGVLAVPTPLSSPSEQASDPADNDEVQSAPAVPSQTPPDSSESSDDDVSGVPSALDMAFVLALGGAWGVLGERGPARRRQQRQR
jgi:hypothetical protein